MLTEPAGGPTYLPRSLRLALGHSCHCSYWRVRAPMVTSRHSRNGNRREPPIHQRHGDPTLTESFCSIGSYDLNAMSLLKSTSSSSDHIVQAPFPLPFPQHHSYSQGLYGEQYAPRERSHMRIVIDGVGRSITEFTSTRELVLAIRDAIKGTSHVQLYAYTRHYANSTR